MSTKTETKNAEVDVVEVPSKGTAKETTSDPVYNVIKTKNGWKITKTTTKTTVAYEKKTRTLSTTTVTTSTKSSSSGSGSSSGTSSSGSSGSSGSGSSSSGGHTWEYYAHVWESLHGHAKEHNNVKKDDWIRDALANQRDYGNPYN